MSYLEYSVKYVPRGWRKILHLNWGLVLLLTTVASVGFLMLYSVAGGSMSPWAEPQMKRFALGLTVMVVVALTPIWFWRNISALGYVVSLVLLLLVDLVGVTSGGSQRWIDLGFMRLQPSELAKVTLIMLLAAYYDWLPLKKTSHPLWVAIPVAMILLPTILVLEQPDLGTAMLLMMAGAVMMFLAGVHWGYFAAVIGGAAVTIWAVFESRGTEWQILKNYQYRRIDVFLDPTLDPLGSGYHITQATIALGSGGWTGKGFMQGTQTRLNFLPEKHTDFIFTTLAEEFGFIGAFSLLVLYVLIVVFCIFAAL
ncbi:MAG: FtsW/RodA/SpoVE family cell cycle protein, partial [Paracoccaceae bacterium]